MVKLRWGWFSSNMQNINIKLLLALLIRWFTEYFMNSMKQNVQNISLLHCHQVQRLPTYLKTSFLHELANIFWQTSFWGCPQKPMSTPKCYDPSGGILGGIIVRKIMTETKF